jgi:N-acyl-D-amino-acid deacylase
MTGLPAAKFGFVDRGAVRSGAFADLVVFDPATIADVATYDDPCRFPAGIRAVFVNGTAVARDGEHTGARPGRALRRGGAPAS